MYVCVVHINIFVAVIVLYILNKFFSREANVHKYNIMLAQIMHAHMNVHMQ